MAERHAGEGLVVLLGTPNAESSRLYALTLQSGDPSWAGALAGVALCLPAYHITEDAVKRQIPAAAYQQHVALMEMAMEVGAISAALQAVRDEAPGG